MNEAIDVIYDEQEKLYKVVHVSYDMTTQLGKVERIESISPDKYRIGYELQKLMANKMLKLISK